MSKNSPVTAERTRRCRETYMPLKLKTLMMQYGLNLGDLCANVNQLNGNPVSKPLMNRLYLHGEWPKKTPAHSIKTQAIAWLKEAGVPDTEADAAFDIDEEAQAEGKPRLGRPTLAAPKTKSAKPEPDP